MKCLTENRIESYSTADTMLAANPLSNIMTDSPTEVAKTAAGSLTFELVTTANESTAIAFVNTNASDIDVLVTSYDNYISGLNWIVGDGIAAYMIGDERNLSFGTGTGTAASADVTLIKGGTVRVEFMPSSITAGTLLSVSVGGATQPLAVGVADNGVLQSFDLVVSDPTQSIIFTADTAFLGNLIDIKLVHVALDISYQLPIGGYFDEFLDGVGEAANYDRKDLMIEFSEPMLEQALVTVVLTGDPVNGTYVGPVRVDRALGMPDPHYGLTKSIKNNDVEIIRLDGSKYRRHRKSQDQYSGKFYLDTEGYAIYKLEQMQREIGSRPVPWQVSDTYGAISFVYGGILSASRSFDFFSRNTYQFTILEEV